jgi:hypothetical protein
LFKRPQSNNVLNQLDLAFIVDTTGSMGAFIQAARQHMVALLKALTAEAPLPIELQVGFVEYRDHPPQEATYVYRAHAFTTDLKRAQHTIDQLTPNGGGDACEAVFDGIVAACDDLKWREHSHRLAVLIGDAPPHGVGFSADSFRDGCPCGLNPDRVTAHVEDANVTLYAVGLTNSVESSFARLARFTGGEYFTAVQGPAAIDAIKGVLLSEFGELDLDRQVLDACRAQPDWTIDAISNTLTIPRAPATRCSSRGKVGMGAHVHSQSARQTGRR